MTASHHRSPSDTIVCRELELVTPYLEDALPPDAVHGRAARPGPGAILITTVTVDSASIAGDLTAYGVCPAPSTNLISPLHRRFRLADSIEKFRRDAGSSTR